MATNQQDLFFCCYQNWMTQQRQDLDELLNGLAANSADGSRLHSLAETSIKHFQDYSDVRAEFAKLDAPSFLCPSWCSSLENSFLWIGGCRPSLSIRLVYALSGYELEEQLVEFFRGERKGNLGDITAKQLELINLLQSKTVREEDKLSSRMASLQEDVADSPLVIKAKEASRVGESSGEIEKTLQAHMWAMGLMLVDADKLRVSTLKELIEILSPLQSVDLLAASKKLHLSINEWGKQRDVNLGKMCNVMNIG